MPTVSGLPFDPKDRWDSLLRKICRHTAKSEAGKEGCDR